jgi:hypothetical protein
MPPLFLRDYIDIPAEEIVNFKRRNWNTPCLLWNFLPCASSNIAMI